MVTGIDLTRVAPECGMASATRAGAVVVPGTGWTRLSDLHYTAPMYLRSRSLVLARIRLDAHEPRNSGATTDDLLVQHLQVATDAVWERVAARSDGPGRVHETRTIAPGDPSGYVPGSVLPLPARFLSLVPDTLRQNGALLLPGRDDRNDFNVGGRYWLDGPTQATVLGLLQPVPRTLLTSTPWSSGDLLEWMYIERAPQWVDPADPARDVQVDLVSTSIESAIVAITVARATAKGNREDLARARAVQAEELDRLDERAPDLEQPHRLVDFRRRGRRYSV